VLTGRARPIPGGSGHDPPTARSADENGLADNLDLTASYSRRTYNIGRNS
jgi:hypothetical protein